MATELPVVVAGVTTCQGGREGRPQGEGAQVIGYRNREVCAMQNAKSVLGVLRDRGRKGLPCNELYRQMFNRDLYLLAYGRIYANHGAMTPGPSAETADGMSEDTIDQIIEAMRHERYRFGPVPDLRNRLTDMSVAWHFRNRRVPESDEVRKRLTPQRASRSLTPPDQSSAPSTRG